MTGSDGARPLQGRDLFAGGFLSPSDFADAGEAGLPKAIGPYRVEGRLGEGGMASVYLVHDPERDAPAALKLLGPEAVATSAYARFWREAQVLAKVRHRNVVRIHTLGEAEAGPFLLLERVEGESLRGPRPPEEAARLALDLAGALSAIHAAGVVHRDVKPANVVVQDGIPVLLDFGVARDLDAETLTRTGAILGTPAYVAPEQARGERADARADVYGLGGLLYTLLTGEPPYRGSAVEVLTAVVRGKRPEPPRRLDRAIPRGLEAICLRALARAPEDRYPSAEALAADLERFLAGRPPAALPSRWAWLGDATRGRSRAALIGAPLLALLALLAAAVWATRGPAPGGATGSRPPTVVEPSTAPAPLWSLRSGDALPFRTVYRERARGTAMKLEVWFQAAASERAGGLRLRVSVEAIAAEFRQDGAGRDGLGLRFDSREPPPASHPLSAMRRAVGQTYAFTLDPQDGQVRDLEGMPAIAAAVETLTGPPTPLLQAGTYRRFCRRAFSDGFITRVLDSLLRVRGEGRALPWRANADGSYTLRSTPAGPPVLDPLTPGWQARAEHRYRIRGAARYAEGRLRSAWAEQGLATGQESCWVRWAFYSP